MLSTRYLKNRHFNASLKNIAVWGYWRNRISDEEPDNEQDKEDHKPRVGMYGKGTSREGAPWFEALTDESGWAWFIPLHNGKTSVGIVMNQEQYNKSRPSSSDAQYECSLVGRYLANLRLAPGVARLLCGKDVVHNGSDSEHEIHVPIEEEILHQQAKLEPGSVRSASDFSYSAPNYAGKGFRIVGDAGGDFPNSTALDLVPDDTIPTLYLNSLHRPILFVWYPSCFHRCTFRCCDDLCVSSRKLHRG